MENKELTSNLIDMYGLTSVFQMLVASMVSNNPNIVIVGDPGSGKTEMIKRIAAMLNAAFGIELFMADATTFDPDDHIGTSLPIVSNSSTRLSAYLNTFLKAFSEAPEGMPFPKQVYVGIKAVKAFKYTGITHMEKVPNYSTFLTAEMVAIDEISRATPRGSNAFLQLYSNNRVDGQPLKAMFKFAMMNDPASHAGAEELSSAMGERFAIVHVMPHAGEMSLENRKAGTSLQPLIDNFWLKEKGERKDWDPSDIKERGKFFADRLCEIKLDFLALRQTHGPVVVEYVDALCIALEKETDIKIEFRRRQFLFDNILALYATMRGVGSDDLSEAAYTAIQVSFPGWVYGEPLDKEKLLVAHEVAQRFLVNPKDRVILELLDIQRKNSFLAAAEAIKRGVGMMHISKFIDHAINDENESAADREAFAVALLSMKNLKLQANDLRMLYQGVKHKLFNIMEAAK